LGKLRSIAEVLDFVAEVVIVDCLHFWFEGYCLALGRQFVELVEDMWFVELVGGMWSVELMDVVDGWLWHNDKIDSVLEVVLGWFGTLVVKKAKDKMVSTVGGEGSIAWCG
jgi:hypothetical protein